jgi:hypothetical protein
MRCPVASMKPRGGIGMQEGWLREGLSGQVAAMLGIGERQELVQLPAGFEGVGGEVIERPNRRAGGSG